MYDNIIQTFLSGGAAMVNNAQTGTSYAIQESDGYGVVTLSNTSAVAVSLAQAGTAGFAPSGWWVWLKNINSGVVTVTVTTSTIDGASVMVMPPGSSALVYSIGTNFELLNGTTGGTSTPAFFGTQGGFLWSVVGAGSACVAVANQVYGFLVEIPTPTLVKHISAIISTGVASTGTIALGLCDVNGGKIFSTGSTAATSSNLQIAAALGTTYLLLPGTYRTVWTANSTSIVFYPSSGYNIGSSYTTTWNLRSVKSFLCSTAASSGDIPATLGTFSASGVAIGTAIPAILYEP